MYKFVYMLLGFFVKSKVPRYKTIEIFFLAELMLNSIPTTKSTCKINETLVQTFCLPFECSEKFEFLLSLLANV